MVSVDYNCLWFKATDTVSRPYLCFYRLIDPELTFHFLLHGVVDDNSLFGMVFQDGVAGSCKSLTIIYRIMCTYMQMVLVVLAFVCITTFTKISKSISKSILPFCSSFNAVATCKYTTLHM